MNPNDGTGAHPLCGMGVFYVGIVSAGNMEIKMNTKSAALVLAGLFCISVVQASEGPGEGLGKAFTNGELKFNFRYRYEFVDQDGLDREANASTLRGRLSWTSARLGAWQWGAEADYVALLGDERYNSTENGRTEFPVVADPEGFDLNQAYVRYHGEGFSVSGGRQRILLGQQRFIGGVAWRQNEQTFDALRGEFKLHQQLSVDYSYVWNVNRIFGPEDGAQPADWRSDSHLLNLRYTPAEGHAVTVFGYLLDFDNDNGPPNSTSTYGLSYRGQFGPLTLDGSYATQADYADSPLDYDADFYSLAAAWKFKPLTLSAGYEVLDSDDGAVGFRTPLATLHKFQGWSDKFLGTPAAGIEDRYVGVAGAVGPVKVAATYHVFEAEEGSADYGEELNLVANYKVADGMSLQLKYADYDADEIATDTTKFWLSFIVSI